MGTLVGSNVGSGDGSCVGSRVGRRVGRRVGLLVGADKGERDDGFAEGAFDGLLLERIVGLTEGDLVGRKEGFGFPPEGSTVDVTVGAMEGQNVGLKVGRLDGFFDLTSDTGVNVGEAVGRILGAVVVGG